MRLIKKYRPGMIVSAAICTMVISFMFTLADVALKPAVHSAPSAVLNNSPSLAEPDQERATLVSLSGSVPDHLYYNGFFNE